MPHLQSWCGNAAKSRALRIDQLLWFLRLARTRTIAQAMAEKRQIRVNSRRVEKAHQNISAGDILTIPMPGGIRIIELIALPERRGPATEAQSCYRVLDETQNLPIAAVNRNDA